MYSRSYEKTPPGVNLPNDYCGTALLESTHAEEDQLSSQSRIDEEDAITTSAQGTNGGIFSSVLSRIRGVELGGFVERGKLLLQDLGTEEILIISVALILFFSRERDIECGLMLLLLLFIG